MCGAGQEEGFIFNGTRDQGSKNNTVIRQCCTGHNMYLQVERKSGVKLECSIEMNKRNYLVL